MTPRNDLDPARMLDATCRAHAGGPREKRYLFFVSDRGRGRSIIRDLEELGWKSSRVLLEASLPGVSVRFVSIGGPAGGADKAKGCAIHGYAVDEDIALDGRMRLNVLLPAMLGNTPEEAA